MRNEEEIRNRLATLTDAMNETEKIERVIIAVRELEWVLGERRTYQFKELVGPKK